MRYDLRILWVEDTPTFYNVAKENLEMQAEDNGFSLMFDYIEDTKDFFEKMKNDAQGFKLYDIFFVDYSLSNGVIGSSLIKNLRKESVDSDILFYSSENESDIREEIIENLGSYEGVYVANKTNFDEKSNYLINKNARRLTSLSNIRGFLMDQTSENDYTIKSYILRNFSKLSKDQKEEISKMLLNFMNNKLETFENKATNEIETLKKSGIIKIKDTMDMMDELFPIKLKYQIFEKMVAFLDEPGFKEVTVQQYIDEIIGARNKLAHKKLDVCKTQKYIKYYDTITQFEDRKCPNDCMNHSNKYKYSLEEWNDLRKKVQKFGKSIDIIQEKL